jgi:hypothetical protein
VNGRLNWVRASGLLVGTAATLLLIPALFAAAFSAFLFDAPGSERSPLTWALAIGLYVTPLFLVLAMSMAAQGFRTSDRRRILRSALFVAIPILYLGSVYAGIQGACGGQFACS